MPPTQASLHPAIYRANYQTMEWRQSHVQNPYLPSPTECSWNDDNGKFTPVTCDLPCGPDALLTLIKCSCTRGRCALPCKCASNELSCTEMCSCLADEEYCANLRTNDVDDVTDDEGVTDDEDELDEDDEFVID